MDERRLEVKVGLLVLLGVAGVVALLWLMGELAFTRASNLSVQFGHTGNVVQGAPVKLGGVEVGRVQKISLEPARRDATGDPLPVQMELSVDEDARNALHTDAAVTVATVGPLGEPYLELQTGTVNAPLLQRGAILRGTDAPRLDLVALQLSRFLDASAQVLEKNPRALELMVGGITKLTTNVDEVLTENRDDLRTLATELSLAAKDLRALAMTARRNFEPGGKADRMLDDAAASAKVLRSDVPQLSQDARKLMAQLNALSGQLSPEDMQRLKVAIERYSAAGEKLDRLAARGEKLLADIENGQGTLGQLQNDPELYKDLKALVEDLRKHPWKVLWKD